MSRAPAAAVKNTSIAVGNKIYDENAIACPFYGAE